MRAAFRISPLAIGLASLLGAGAASAGALVEFPNLPEHAPRLLADLGATVLRIDRSGGSDLGVPRPLRYDLLLRGRRCLALDLKHPDGKALALRLVERAAIEGFRPGVTERLGLGPEDCLARNPRLFYAGSPAGGQEGPLAQPPGTISTTSRSPVRHTPSGGAASRRPRP